MTGEMEYPLAEKERLLFEAVGRLLDEGADINRLKVSDITGKAGIGKGTAYEYFNSKEELIAKAMSYRLFAGVKEVLERIVSKTDFYSKMEEIFCWVEEKSRSAQTSEQFLKLFLQSYEQAEPFRSEGIRLFEEQLRSFYRQAVSQLVESGRRDGVIGGQVSDNQAMQVLFSQYFAYLNYLQHRDCMKEEAGWKPFVRQCILRCLK